MQDFRVSKAAVYRYLGLMTTLDRKPMVLLRPSDPGTLYCPVGGESDCLFELPLTG